MIVPCIINPFGGLTRAQTHQLFFQRLHFSALNGGALIVPLNNAVFRLNNKKILLNFAQKRLLNCFLNFLAGELLLLNCSSSNSPNANISLQFCLSFFADNAFAPYRLFPYKKSHILAR